MKPNSGGKFVKFRRGQIIVGAGEGMKKIMTEGHGLTRVYWLGKQGQEIPVAMVNGLWEVSVLRFFGEGKDLQVEAVTSGEMRVWEEAEAKAFLKKEDGVLMNPMAELMRLTARLLTGNARQKVAAVILEANRKRVDAGLAHKIIAGMTGLTRETVTLQMIRLEKEGLIDNKNRAVRVIQPEKLEEIVSSS